MKIIKFIADISNLPPIIRTSGALVQGRATVELTLKKADPAAKFFVDGKTYDDAKLNLVPAQLGTRFAPGS
jgi:hypothetical protein